MFRQKGATLSALKLESRLDPSNMAAELVRENNPGVISFRSEPSYLTAIGSVDYFTANKATTGRELWKSDGSSTGTTLIRDLNPVTPGGNPGKFNSHPRYFTDVNGTLYFTARENSTYHLWKTDGTSSGTVFVRDIRPGSQSSGLSLFSHFS